MRIVKIAASAALLFFVAQSQAGILFEPYAGYTIGDLKMNTGAAYPVAAMQSHSYSGSIDGFGYGAKLAWTFDRLYFGGEYQAARAKEKLNSSDTVTDWNNTSIFGIVGLQLYQGLRLSYGMTVTPHKSEEVGDPDRITYTGSAQKLSLGFRYRAPFAINVDYIQYNLKKFTQGTTEGFVKDRFDKLNYSAFLLSISFPFEVGER